MAADINLLPEDFRREEEKAKQRARKKSTEEPIRLTKPENGGVDTTKKFWHKVVKHDGVHTDDGTHSPGSPLQDAVAKSFKKRIRKTPNFLVDDTTTSNKKNGSHDGRDLDDVLDDSSEYLETAGEKQAKVLRKKGSIKDSDDVAAEEKKGPKILIEKSDDNGELTFLDRLKKLQKIIAEFITSLLGRYSNQAVEVNLMPEKAVGFKEVNWRKLLTSFVSVMVIAALIIAAGYTGILSRIRTEERSFNELQMSIDDLEAKILAFADRQAQAFAVDKELSNAKKLLNNHIFWTQFLTFLERSTIESVRYATFDGVIDTPIILIATTDSVESVLLQRQIFLEAPDVQSVVLDDFQPDAEGIITVTFTLILEPAVWRRS